MGNDGGRYVSTSHHLSAVTCMIRGLTVILLTVFLSGASL